MERQQTFPFPVQASPAVRPSVQVAARTSSRLGGAKTPGWDADLL
jgi:transcription elongation factor